MKIEVQEHVIRIIVIKPKESIDAFKAPALRDKFNTFTEAGNNKFVLDLSDTPFLDSAGMAAMVSLLKTARTAGGDVKLVWPQNEAAKRIIQLTKFDRVFDMAENAEEALAAFS